MNACVKYYYKQLKKKFHSKFIRKYMKSRTFYADIAWLSPEDDWATFYGMTELTPFLHVEDSDGIVSFFKDYSQYRINHIQKLYFVVETKEEKQKVIDFMSETELVLPEIIVDVYHENHWLDDAQNEAIDNEFRERDYKD